MAQPDPAPVTFELVEDVQVNDSNADLWMRTERWQTDAGILFRTLVYGRTAQTPHSPAVALVFVPTP